MKDKLESRTQFRTDYKSYRKDVLTGESTTDPIKRIVADQTYEYSYNQYKGFRKSIRTNEFRKVLEDENFKEIIRQRGLSSVSVDDLKKVSEYQFRSGQWQKTKEFYDTADAYYWYMKDQAKATGINDEKEQWMYAKNEVAKSFFGRPEEYGYYGDS